MLLKGNDCANVRESLAINNVEYDGQAGSKIIGDVQVIFESKKNGKLFYSYIT